MSQPIYIITGASKGMGLEMARQLLSSAHRVLCISRTASAELTQAALEADAFVLQWCENLADTAPVAPLAPLASVSLINNAGTVQLMAAFFRIGSAPGLSLSASS